MEDKPIERPPLGLMPKRFWYLQRRKDILEAVDRFIKAGRAVPFEWSDEYTSICVAIAQMEAKDAIKLWKQAEF